jgi:reductive dehalogenase
MNGMQANVPLGIFSGLTEQGRPGYNCNTDHGLALRYCDYVLTDLPIAPTKPIDAGITEFCKVCARCAEICPTNSVSKDTDISWEGAGPFTRLGFKGWSLNIQTCYDFGSPSNCCACQSVCPFNHPEESVVHELVRGTVGTTSVFNGFFANMDRVMGYGKPKDGEETWWNRDLRTWKYDTLYGFGTAGW